MAPAPKGVVHQLLERAHSPDTAHQIYTDKIQHRELFLRPTSPSREVSEAVVGGSSGTPTTTTTTTTTTTATKTAASNTSRAAAAAAVAAAEAAAAGSSGHNGRDLRRRARRIKQEQRQHRARTLKPKPLSARQRRELGLYDVPTKGAEGSEGGKGGKGGKGQGKNAQKLTAGQSYATFVPLHRLWLGYMREVLSPQDFCRGGPDACAKVAAADLHGAGVTVSRSTCVSRVGIRGIVVRETQFLFEIVTWDNKLKKVPKEQTFFQIAIPVEGASEYDQEEEKTDEEAGAKTTVAAAAATNEPQTAQTAQPAQPSDKGELVLEIVGSRFMHKAEDRATRKFKYHFNPEL